MQISSRFTIALHVLACIAVFEKQLKVTSAFLSGSVNVNAVIIRNILLQLKAAELIRVERGTGGAYLEQPADEISLLDVYKAIEPLEKETLFRFHDNPNPRCPVGRNIHGILDQRLLDVQNTMENELQSMTLADILSDLTTKLQKEKKE
ncbi:MAG: Rrf2 family transcriptional regulator [Alphaproteobacteria bacterium]|nr:Rrf2 family transcriptional regulator [Alphaproteobacteria bacterium]